MATPTVSPSPQAQRQHFTLAGLFSFFVAAAVYLSMLCSIGPAIRPSWQNRESAFWPLLVTVPTAWVVLCLLYNRWHLRQAQIVHFSGIIMAWFVVMILGCLGAIVCLVTRSLSGIVDFLEIALVLTYAGLGMGTLVSFPCAVLMLAYLGLRKPDVGQAQPPPRDGQRMDDPGY